MILRSIDAFFFTPSAFKPPVHSLPSKLSPLALPAAGISQHGEGPVWDARLRRLYWVNIVHGQLLWLDENAQKCRALEFPPPLGFVALTDDPGVLVAGLASSLALLHLESGRVEALAQLESPDAPFRCNDGKCDPTGRVWAGTMSTNPDAQPPGSLFSLKPSSPPQRVLRDVGCSNGLAWNMVRREFYFIDSLAHRVDRFRWDPETGDITHRSTLASFPDDHGLPDGMCIDTDGHLWVAFWDGSCVRHIHHETGDTLATIQLPAKRVTSCTFGGPDLATLYITTSHEGLSPSERTAQPLAGSVFSVTPGARGLPADYFHLRTLAS